MFQQEKTSDAKSGMMTLESSSAPPFAKEAVALLAQKLRHRLRLLDAVPHGADHAARLTVRSLILADLPTAVADRHRPVTPDGATDEVADAALLRDWEATEPDARVLGAISMALELLGVSCKDVHQVWTGGLWGGGAGETAGGSNE